MVGCGTYMENEKELFAKMFAKGLDEKKRSEWEKIESGQFDFIKGPITIRDKAMYDFGYTIAWVHCMEFLKEHDFITLKKKSSVS